MYNKDFIEKYTQSLIKHGYYKKLFCARREAKRVYDKSLLGLIEPLKCPASPDTEVIVEDGKVTFILK